MGYELYQSRHKGYEIDNLLDDVVDLNTDVAGLKEGYNANKVNMPDGSALPTYLATNMATKTDISDMATKTQVASDINTATKDLVDGNTVDSKISTATKDLVDGDTVDSKISTATADFITSTDIPTASATNKGMVKPDGTTITVDADGTIHGASAIDNLTDIGDVSIVSATDKQVLAYNASKSKWENQDASGGGGGTTDYNDLKNKPKIHGKILTSETLSSDILQVENVSGLFFEDNDWLSIKTAGKWQKGVIKMERDNDNYYPFYIDSDGNLQMQKAIRGAQGPLKLNYDLLEGTGSWPLYTDETYGELYIHTATDNYLGVVKGGKNTTIGTDGSINVADATGVADYLYSTTEQCIGCWIDGRPIYRKCIQTTTPTVTTSGTAAKKLIPHNISNLKKVVNTYGYCSSVTNGNEWSVPVNWYGGSATNYVMVYRGGDNLEIYATTVTFSNIELLIILEYTKTSDAANSFTLDKLSTGTLDSTATDAEVTEVLK